MNIWLILWFLLAVALVAFFAWTFMILMRQKNAWRIFAQKRKLRFEPGALMDSPSFEGVIGEHSVNCFTSEHLMKDARSTRKLTAIEVKLNSVMPVAGGIASGGMIPIMAEMNFRQEYVPEHQDWDKSYVASADNRDVLAAYLTDERIAALCQLMKIKNCWAILVFKGDAMLLRIDIADPLPQAKQLNAVIKDMLGVAEVLELKKGEAKRLESEEFQSVAKGVELEIDGDDLDVVSGLTLEEEDEGDGKVEDGQSPAPSKQSEKKT